MSSDSADKSWISSNDKGPKHSKSGVRKSKSKKERTAAFKVGDYCQMEVVEDVPGGDPRFTFKKFKIRNRRYDDEDDMFIYQLNDSDTGEEYEGSKWWGEDVLDIVY